MLLVKCGGGSTKKDETQTFIYKDGDECTSFTGGLTFDYTYSSSMTEVNTTSSKDSASIDLKVSSASKTSTIGTTNAIDVTDYMTLNALVVVNSVEKLLSIDVSSTEGSYYIGVSHIRNSSSNTSAILLISNTQANYNDTVNRLNYASYGLNAGYSDVYVKRIWLSKPVYLYKDGDEFTSVSGGWIEHPSGVSSSTPEANNLVKNTNNMYCNLTANKSTYAITQNAIDVSEYSTVKAIVTCNGTEQTITCSISLSQSVYISVGGYRGDSTRYPTLDIQSDNSSYLNNSRVGHTSGTSYTSGTYGEMYINRVWLEK